MADNMRQFYQSKTAQELMNDLRRLVQAGVTPKAGPWSPHRLGWNEETWREANRLGIKLAGRKHYAEVLGPLRPIIVDLHEEEGVPHAGFAKISLGGDAQNMIKDLAIYYLAYRRFPERDVARQGRGGWSLSSNNMAERLGIRLASTSKYRYWFGTPEEAETLAMQLVRHGYNGDQPVTAILSQLNVVPPSSNKRGLIQHLRQHPRWRIVDTALPIPEPQETAPVSETNPNYNPFVLPHRPAQAPEPKPIDSSVVPIPKYLPGTIVLAKIGTNFKVCQVEAIGVRWTRSGASFNYEVKDVQGGSGELQNETDLFTPDQFADLLADLAKLAETKTLPLHMWRQENPLTST